RRLAGYLTGPVQRPEGEANRPPLRLSASGALRSVPAPRPGSGRRTTIRIPVKVTGLRVCWRSRRWVRLEITLLRVRRRSCRWVRLEPPAARRAGFPRAGRFSGIRPGCPRLEVRPDLLQLCLHPPQHPIQSRLDLADEV